MRLRADRKVARIEEGIERNAAWRKLPPSEKIKQLQARSGQSKRQLTKFEVYRDNSK